ncbi:M15 family metallopeptidase [Symbiopectobacterium purcellii]|uniref:M15 family metallopeptidase n=1 Tax=Symbiopectobacterium purcellii TaxID=2871826 RepID=A0ABX9AT45_9ENTR|nr:M15 family metallopeptidase [Symbiopectobacterium purcellii]QZN96960.1 M15 family metallopeptidase [Symbiopectobacterium purcellii]
MMTHAMLTGKTREHLVPLGETHSLQPAALAAFTGLQQAAARDGFQLQPASTFRDFARQRHIWNQKFNGERPLLDKNSQPLVAAALSVAERCAAILRWSALPGASRHHWGTELDIYDPSRLPQGARLQLEPWEYQADGYFAELNDWLTAHMAQFDFYRPFAHDRGGVAIEPWHISYHPLARPAAQQLTPEVILEAWQHEDIAGDAWLRPHLPDIFSRFIMNIDED